MINRISMNNINFKGNFRIAKDDRAMVDMIRKEILTSPEHSREAIAHTLNDMKIELSNKTSDNIEGYITYEHMPPKSGELSHMTISVHAKDNRGNYETMASFAMPTQFSDSHEEYKKEDFQAALSCAARKVKKTAFRELGIDIKNASAHELSLLDTEV